MIVLGIETSGYEGSVALIRDDQCLVERSLNQSGRRHAQSLVLEIGEILKSYQLTPRDVDAIAVSRGPGSFTGLRVGMVCAKTFAYATQCRFVAVDTFAAIAENAPKKIDRVTVVEDAQRDDLFVGEYSRDVAHSWTQTVPIRVVSRADFLREVPESVVVIGPGLKKLEPNEIRPHWLADPASCLPRASVIAFCGQRRLSSPVDSADTDFWRSTPFYVRASAAEEKRASLTKNADG